MKQLLDVENLSVCFDTRNGPVPAVENVSFSLGAGESLAIVGESGSGKSITALSLLGLVPPPGRITNGSLHFAGRDLRALTERQMQQVRGRDIAMVFQDPMTSLNPVLRIGVQMGETLRRHESASRKAIHDRVVDTLQLVGIPNAKSRVSDYPHQFSGGQRQRIMIAMAIICRPQLLLADEPTTALDVTIQAQIVDLVKALQAELGMTVVWITHDLALIAGIVDQVAVMYAGSIVEQGAVQTLFGAARHPYTQGLLESMPDFRSTVRERLPSIKGIPPSPGERLAGCPFAPRCSRVVSRCEIDRPVLTDKPAHTRVACWQADST